MEAHAPCKLLNEPRCRSRSRRTSPGTSCCHRLPAPRSPCNVIFFPVFYFFIFVPPKCYPIRPTDGRTREARSSRKTAPRGGIGDGGMGGWGDGGVKAGLSHFESAADANRAIRAEGCRRVTCLKSFANFRDRFFPRIFARLK